MAVSILDERGNVLKTIHTDAHDPDRMVELLTQNVDPLIEHVRRQREARGTTMAGHQDGMVLAGYVPDFAVERMVRENGGHFPTDEQIERFLNDPANDVFRVWAGRL